MKRRLCSLAELPAGGARVFVVENRCSHDDGPLGEGKLFGLELECPRHGARFDVSTGRATRMPAVAPIETFPAAIEGADVFVEMPEF